MSLRIEPSIQYKRMIKRTLVAAFRTVFSKNYPDTQFKDLYVSTTYPIKRESFPAILVNYNEASVQNMGVAHSEQLQSESGAFYPSRHFMFEGSIDVICVALSPLDLDTLTDSVVEIISFGRLDSLLEKFFESIYKNLNDSAQIALQTDYMKSIAQSTMQNSWDAEDILIYQSGYNIVCNGAFYSNPKENSILEYIDDIIVYGKESLQEQEEELLHMLGNNNPDPFYVKGRGIVLSEDATN